MTDPHQNINEIMSTAANSMAIPVAVAQLFMQVATELSRLRTEVEEQRQMLLGHERRIADANRNISRLSGVHGA